VTSHSAAIFSLERVLLTQAPDSTFSRSLRDAGLSEPALAQLAGLSSRLLAAVGGENTLSAQASRAALAPGAGWSVAAVDQAAGAAADQLASQILPHAPVEIEDHRVAGRRLVMVSAHPEPLVAPLAERWGFDDVVATRWEADGGVFTGRTAGTFVWGRGRLGAVKDWAGQHGVSLDESYVYGGSLADGPLLGAVGHPRVVNPEAGLVPLATARRWPIRWFDAPPGVVKVAGRELQEWLRPLTANEQLVGNAQIEISGVEQIPRHGAAIVAFNHRSYFDASVISILIAKSGRAARGIGKKEVFDAPLIGRFAHAFGGIRVDRGTGSNEPLHRAERALRAGELVMIAPEGTIPRGMAFFEPELRGRWGTARLAHATKAPVIPVGLWGTEHVWPRNQRLPTLRFAGAAPTVTAEVGPPVALAYDDIDADTKRILTAIVDLLPPEARVRRTPTVEELRLTYPANYKGDPARELERRPGFDV
jgi:putative phosphoserine phosphatase / 1-acylglycerol-3-phosphate O-acyltransferase